MYFDPGAPETERTIPADWIAEAVKKGARVEVNNAVIRGRLNLRYEEIKEEFFLMGCNILDAADFSYGSFKRNVILQATTFHQGARFDSATMYYDAFLRGTRFPAGEAVFIDLRAHGIFSGIGAKFGPGVLANFNRASFEKSAFFSKAEFGGDALFIATQIATNAEFNEAQFNSVSARVSFDGAYVKGSAFFRGATFAGNADFRGIHIGGTAEFQGAVFKQNAIFNTGRIDGIVFFRATPDLGLPAATFEGEANFIAAQFGSDAEFGGVQFRSVDKPVSFTRAFIAGKGAFDGVRFAGAAQFINTHIVGDADFQGAVFKRKANFNGVKIDGHAFFRADSDRKLPSPTFGGKADFIGAQIGRTADFRGAVFKDWVSFNSARVEGAAFFRAEPDQKQPAATFDGEADFRGVKIGSDADFDGVQFNDPQEPVTFNQAVIKGRAFFEGVHFAGEVDFVGTNIAGMADFQGAVFKGKANFNGVNFEGNALYHAKPEGKLPPAAFEAECDFTTARFGRDVNFSGVKFKSRARFDASSFLGLAQFSPSDEEKLPGAVFDNVSFDHARFEGDARFDDAVFRGPASFREASFRVVYFSRDGQAQGHEQFQETLDLRGCTYDRIQMHWSSLGTKVTPYDRQPYTQAEKVLWSVGQDLEADKVYLERRAAERRQKFDRGDYVPWVLDWFYKLAANYGVRPYRLVIIPLLLIALGTIVFSHPGAIQPIQPKVSSTPAPLDSTSELAPDTPIGPLSWWDAFRLSLRLFIPVKVPLATAWEPSDKYLGPVKFSDLATALTLAGWILVPLGIAALTGLLRRAGP